MSRRGNMVRSYTRSTKSLVPQAHRSARSRSQGRLIALYVRSRSVDRGNPHDYARDSDDESAPGHRRNNLGRRLRLTVQTRGPSHAADETIGACGHRIGGCDGGGTGGRGGIVGDADQPRRGPRAAHAVRGAPEDARACCQGGRRSWCSRTSSRPASLSVDKAVTARCASVARPLAITTSPRRPLDCRRARRRSATCCSS